MKDKPFFVIISILAVAVLISLPSFLMTPTAKGEMPVSRLPMQIGEWRGTDLAVDKRAYEILETKNLILREYARGDDKVYLYLIYSQDNRKVSHPPEVCFEGSGIAIVKKEKIPLELAEGRKVIANKLIVENGGSSNLVIYWYKAGRHHLDNYLKQQLRIALSRLQFKQTSGALIRLTSEIPPSGQQKALQNIRQFAKEASRYFDTIIP